MPSPFPGMDPYLEQFWRDIHHRLITYACDQLQPRLPGMLRARVEERVFVESNDGFLRNLYPDLRVVERGFGGAGPMAASNGVAVAEPLIFHANHEPMTEGFIEIIDVGRGKRVVTVIEFLSITNKQPGAGLDDFLTKREDCSKGQVNLVEIDLLREGKRVFDESEAKNPLIHGVASLICVRRCWKQRKTEFNPVRIDERLPVFRVPLRENDDDVLLDVQALIDQCYRNGGYDNDIDYRLDPVPPLRSVDAQWADALLRSKGKR